MRSTARTAAPGLDSVPRWSRRGRRGGGYADLAANHPTSSRHFQDATVVGKASRNLVDRDACVKMGTVMFSRITPRV